VANTELNKMSYNWRLKAQELSQLRMSTYTQVYWRRYESRCSWAKSKLLE